MATTLTISLGSKTHLKVKPFPLADANGNAVAFIDNAGNIQAHYTYDAFGGTISQSGDMADGFRFRFSSKYLDDEAELYFYGFRYYDPALGRWISKDPIGEWGGLLLYGFVENSTVNYVDIWGLKNLEVKVDKCQAIMIMGHGAPAPDNIKWKFPSKKTDPHKCAVGGALVCFPEDNNPTYERRWPRTPRHNSVMVADTGVSVLKEPVVTSDAPDAADKPDYGDNAIRESNISKAIDNALSRPAITSILDQLCKDCPDVTFIFRTLGRKKSIFGDSYMDSIKKSTGMDQLQEKTKVIPCSQPRCKDKAIDLRNIKPFTKYDPIYQK